MCIISVVETFREGINQIHVRLSYMCTSYVLWLVRKWTITVISQSIIFQMNHSYVFVAPPPPRNASPPPPPPTPSVLGGGSHKRGGGGVHVCARKRCIVVYSTIFPTPICYIESILAVLSLSVCLSHNRNNSNIRHYQQWKYQHRSYWIGGQQHLVPLSWNKTGFTRRLKNLETENGYGKVMEHGKLPKSHGILLSVMEFYQFCLRIVPNVYVVCHH